MYLIGLVCISRVIETWPGWIVPDNPCYDCKYIVIYYNCVDMLIL